MQSGKLNKRVELQSLSSSRNAYGESVDTYSTYATVWAQIVPLRGDEKEQANQISASLTHKIVIRYNSSVAERDRIVYDSRTFEINSIVNPFEKNQQLELMCSEVK